MLSIIFICILLLTGCSNKSIDKSLFIKAKINQGGNSTWEVKVKSWEDFGEQIQIETDTGIIILVDKSNVILFNK